MGASYFNNEKRPKRLASRLSSNNTTTTSTIRSLTMRDSRDSAANSSSKDNKTPGRCIGLEVCGVRRE